MPRPYAQQTQTPTADGYLALVGGVLRQALLDCRSSNPVVRTEAMRFFQSPELRLWVELTGGDAQKVLPALRQAAGLG